MNRQQFKFEMESGAELIPHLDASPGTSPHKNRCKGQPKAEKEQKEEPKKPPKL